MSYQEKETMATAYICSGIVLLLVHWGLLTHLLFDGSCMVLIGLAVCIWNEISVSRRGN